MDKMEIAKENLKILSKIEDSMKLETMIKDNKIEFESDGKFYRVRLLNFVERNELQNIRRLKYVEYLKDKEMLFRKQWVELYKTKGVDIDKMETAILTKQAEIKQLLLRLVKLEDPNSVKTISVDIEKLRSEQYELVVEKTDLLQYSIEDQLLIHVNSYTSYLALELKKEETWVKAFGSFVDFQNCNDMNLMAKTFEYVNSLFYSDSMDNKNS